MNLLASANLIMGAWWPPTRSADQSRTRPRTMRPEDLFDLLAATTSVRSRVGSRGHCGKVAHLGGRAGSLGNGSAA
jgi:hypothetical protein